MPRGQDRSQTDKQARKEVLEKCAGARGPVLDREGLVEWCVSFLGQDDADEVLDFKMKLFKLSDLDLRIVACRLAGFKQGEIADYLGVDQSLISLQIRGMGKTSTKKS